MVAMASIMSRCRCFAGPNLLLKSSRNHVVRPMAVLKTVPKNSAPAKKKAPTAKGKPLEQITSNPNNFQIGFTKSNELFVGRVAMLGFASSLIGEILTGKGALSQLGYELGVPTFEVDWFIGLLITFNIVAALLPTSGKFVPEQEEETQDLPSQDPWFRVFQVMKFLGFARFGFTKENELFVGRTAQLGFAASLIGEIATGKGPLAQFGFETGIPIWETEFGLLAFIGFLLYAAINEGSGTFVDDKTAEELSDWR